MKKAIALLLSVLMIFSAFGMTLAFAANEAQGAGDVYTVFFVNYDGSVLAVDQYEFGQAVIAPENPTKASTEENEYIFIGWSNGKDEKLYQAGTVPAAYEDVTYTAVYHEKKIVEVPTFWNLVQRVFARINAMLEYISRIFTKK